MTEGTRVLDWETLVYKADPDRDKVPPVEYQFSNGKKFRGGDNRSAYEEDEE